jgi:hypothetical protein
MHKKKYRIGRIIDIYTHILPDRFFRECRASRQAENIGARCAA